MKRGGRGGEKERETTDKNRKREKGIRGTIIKTIHFLGKIAAFILSSLLMPTKQQHAQLQQFMSSPRVEHAMIPNLIVRMTPDPFVTASCPNWESSVSFEENGELTVTHTSKKYGLKMYQHALYGSDAANFLWEGSGWQLAKLDS